MAFALILNYLTVPQPRYIGCADKLEVLAIDVLVVCEEGRTSEQKEP